MTQLQEELKLIKIEERRCEEELEAVKGTVKAIDAEMKLAFRRNVRLGIEGVLRAAQPKQVYVNEKKRTVTVKFDTGEVETVTCAPEDTFDVEVGITTAIATYHAGGKKIYHAMMERLLKKVQKQ